MSRQPQQSRSRITRDRLLDATIETLADAGWAGTTVVAVAQRAGVSRGAAQHHFTTRYDLVVAAVERVTAQLREDLTKQEPALPAVGRPQAALQVLADLWTGTIGRAALQLWVAATTDPQLRDLVLKLERDLSRELLDASVALLGSDLSQPRVRETLSVTFHTLRGIGLASLLRRDGRHHGELVQLAAMLASVPGMLGPV